MENFEEVVEAKADLRAARSAAASFTSSTRFGRSPGRAPRALGADSFAALPEPVRLSMSLIARQAAGPDQALAPVIDLLVDGDAEERAAIVKAFQTNEPLREQWLRTYEILRG